MAHIAIKSARTTIQCHDKWDKMKKKNQKKAMKGVIGVTTASWVWFPKINQILEGTTKADAKPSGID